MKKLSTKVIAVLLCCIMVISTFATTSFAADISEQSFDNKSLSDTNTELYGHALINLRPDYGSNWDGDAVIRNCKWTPNRGGTLTSFCPVIGGKNEQDHDFGYSCSMPHHITIDGLFIDDSRTEEGGGVCLLGNINPLRVSEEYEAAAEYRYGVPESISIRGLTTATGNKPVLSVNEFMYRDVRVEWEN